jgi:hypothetical protein
MAQQKPADETKNNAIPPALAARLNDFDGHKETLLDLLRKEYERAAKAKLRKAHRHGAQAKPFNADRAWQSLRFVASVYLQQGARRQAAIPVSDRVELLMKLGDALRDARRTIDEALQTVGGDWFAGWAVQHGDPDFTDPRIERYHDEFQARIAHLKDLEAAADQAAKMIRRGRGRPPGTTNVPDGVILSLESAYQNSTATKAGTRQGPFERFVRQFLTALGLACSQQAVVDAIRAAKSRDPFAIAISGKTASD